MGTKVLNAVLGEESALWDDCSALGPGTLVLGEASSWRCSSKLTISPQSISSEGGLLSAKATSSSSSLTGENFKYGSNVSLQDPFE